jgi:hypothetical protein
MGRGGVSLGTLVWVILGVIVAMSHGYTITNFSSVVSFLLALFLWPLVLLGVDLHLNFGV